MQPQDNNIQNSFPSQTETDTTQEFMDSVKKKNKKRFITALMIWLAALPAAFIIAMISTFVLPRNQIDINQNNSSVVEQQNSTVQIGNNTSEGNQRSSKDNMRAFFNILIILLGFYAFIGWIPVLIYGTKMSRK